MYRVTFLTWTLLALSLAACTSSSPIDLFGSGSSRQAQTGEQQAESTAEPDGDSGQPQQGGQAAGEPTQLAASSQQPQSGRAAAKPAQKQADAGTPAPAASNQQPGAATPAAGENSLAAAARAQADSNAPPPAGDNSLAAAARANAEGTDPAGYRVEQSGISSEFQRRLNKILGGAAADTPDYDPLVKDKDVVGTWTIEEEDGLRSCNVTMGDRGAGNPARISEGCSAQIAAVSNWDLFGSDLLLRNADNEVVARLRRSDSGANWIGFTIGSGIPIFLTKG